MTFAGMGPDFRLLVRRCRKAAQTYFKKYHESIPMMELVKEAASIMQEFTQSGCVSFLLLLVLCCR